MPTEPYRDPVQTAPKVDPQARLRASISEALRAKPWTTHDLATQLKYNSDQMVRRWLSGKQDISQESVRKIARALRCSVESLDPHKEAYDPENRPPEKRRGRAIKPAPQQAHSETTESPQSEAGGGDVHLELAKRALMAALEAAFVTAGSEAALKWALSVLDGQSWKQKDPAKKAHA